MSWILQQGFILHVIPWCNFARKCTISKEVECKRLQHNNSEEEIDKLRDAVHYYTQDSLIHGDELLKLKRAFFKQFYGSVTKSDYIALRLGFIMTHAPSHPDFDFHKYLIRTLEVDFKKVVGISWYLWLFVVVFLLLNVEGWHTYFWLSFLPLALLLIVGAKLEHVISQLAEEVAEKKPSEQEAKPMTPSDKHFWFGKPAIVLYLIHFILFQNAFEIAFFFWILSTYGFNSCIMEKVRFIVPRLILGVIIQVLCSYITLPLYAIVTQMGTMFKQGMFQKHIESSLTSWMGDVKKRSGTGFSTGDSSSSRIQTQKMATEAFTHNAPQTVIPLEGITTSINECTDSNGINIPLSA